MFSVLLSVYSKEKPEYLEKALQSIWDNQTVRPAEIVLVKDGPLTKGLEDLINSHLNDKPLKIIPLKNNVGLGRALAIGLEHCSYEIVARMDADDIAAKDRFKKQLEYFEYFPDTALLSSDIAEFDVDPSLIKSIRSLPKTHDKIIQFAKRRNPMNHMAVMFRKSAVIEAGNYQAFQGYEDYYLWVRMLQKGFRSANLDENLIYARVGNNMISRRQGLHFFKEELRLQKEFLNIHMINHFEYLRNIILRAFPRLMPVFVLKIIYKTLRK
ncbi:glycosyltransferase [Maribellus maritimus]|uniref:glycosyltransferase n=1 Tax=Maribellus maritimus TaxID=2870838 RepID=UPI001EEB5041|nr:glycosyltransferase [Maribellus maritimus]MCG6191230.1 glycosyltransferase [Maribellus maritimus]